MGWTGHNTVIVLTFMLSFYKNYGPVNFDTINIEDYAANYFSFKYSLEAIFKRQVNLLEEQALKNPYFNKIVESQRQLVYG